MFFPAFYTRKCPDLSAQTRTSPLFNLNTFILLLQMKNSLLDFLGSSLIPELSSDISAGTSCNIQRILVPVATMRTFPHELSFLVCHNLDLSIKSTLLTIITLRIQFCIHDILINKPDYLKHSRNIIFHIRYFHITDCSAC